MASVYSGEYWQGTYTYMRVRVDYSGTSATAYLLWTRTNTYSGTESESGATFSCGGASTSFNFSTSGQQTDRVMASVSFSISTTSSTTVSFSHTGKGSWLSFSGSLTIPAQYSAPTGLALSNVTRLVDGFKADISVSGWGVGGSTSDRYLELSVCQSSGDTTNRNWQIHRGSETSYSITTTNTSYHTKRIDIQPNTMYYLTMYASNGAIGTGNTTFYGNTTAPAAPTDPTVSNIGTDSAILTWTIPADGGEYDKTYYISYDSGATWTSLGTYTGGTAQTGTATLTGLTPGTQYNALLKAHTNAGDSATVSFTFKTKSPIYGPVNGSAKIVTKAYGSVNGVTKEIKHVYGSVNGVTKKIF